MCKVITDLPTPQISVLKTEKFMDVDVDEDIDADGRVLKTKPVTIGSSIHKPI